MAPVVIDLTSSPEPEDSPGKAARTALQNFQPRAQKPVPPPAKKNEQSSQLPQKVARSPGQEVQPKKDKAPANGNGQNRQAASSVPSLLDVANNIAQERRRDDISVVTSSAYRSAYTRPNAPVYQSLGPGRVGYHAHPPNASGSRSSPLVGSHTAAQSGPIPSRKDIPNRSTAEPAASKPSVVGKASAEVINIEDDSDSNSSTNSDSETEIRAVLRENNLEDIRPFKKRKLDAPRIIPRQNGDPITPSLPLGTGAKSASERPPPYPAPGTAPLSGHSTTPRAAALPNSAVMNEYIPSFQPNGNAAVSKEVRSAIQPTRDRIRTMVPHSEGEQDPIPEQAIDASAIMKDPGSSSLASSHSQSQLHPASSLHSPLIHESARVDQDADSKSYENGTIVSREKWLELVAQKSRESSSVVSRQERPASRQRGKPYSQAEDDLLLQLRGKEHLDWKDILPHLPGRTFGSISGHYSELKARVQREQRTTSEPQQQSDSEAKRTGPYSQAEDELLIKLRDVDGKDWNDILSYFPGRAMGSISGHYGQLKVKMPTEAPKLNVPTEQIISPRNRATYTAEEDALLLKLKGLDKLSWEEIVPHFPGRTLGSLQVRFSTKLKSKSKYEPPKPKPVPEQPVSSTSHRVPYSAEEDTLMVKLKEEDGLSWDQMAPLFVGRTAGSLAVRYSSKLKNRDMEITTVADEIVRPTSTDVETNGRHQRRRRHNGPSALSGFISWADVKKSRMNVFEDEESAVDEDEQSHRASHQGSWSGRERVYPKSIERILRQREFGSNAGRSWMPSARSIPDELKEHVFDDVGPRRYFQGTSGDVTCIAWAPHGDRFAAGSIAITDERSMQYNKPCNLLLGDLDNAILRELPEHHVSRPISKDTGNVNSLHSMRETQDQRLFMTVGSVQFSPDGQTLYSAGTDGKARAYSVDGRNARAFCVSEFEHPAPVYLLSVSNQYVLATACHQTADDSVRIYRGQAQLASLSPSRADSQTERPIYPSALKWGISTHHSNLLLAGFSIDSVDEERNLAGETCLWDLHREARIEINAVTRNVFDVAWNPSPSSGSTVFAVASTPGMNKVNRGTRTVVQCFAPRQNRATAVLEFESRAFDINDVVYCPHDNNLIAAGATDGKVYIWDQRYAKKGSGPLHVLAHGPSLNVLDHDRTREVADTGIRFLSWGATSSRLYSGSSDGVVKIWNPYRSSSDAHINDVGTFTSAVMSGAFSPDYRDLLIGEDQGRINLLSIGHGGKSIRSMDRFGLQSAPDPNQCLRSKIADGRVAALELLNSREIEFRPMGALPMRQAVQGRNYAGPFLAPSADELKEAESEYQLALNQQNEAYSSAAMESTQASMVEQSLRDADKCVETAQETLLQLQNRQDDAETLGPKAEALQRGFRKEEKERIKLEASLSRALENCKLDCNYLPPNLDENGEVADSRRSEGRIPAALWNGPEVDASDVTADEAIDASLTRRCITCLKPAPETRSGLPSCESCTRKRMGLTATCEVCSSHVRPSLERNGFNLCERCNFFCFRCGQPTFLAPNAAKVMCERCDLSWTAGALGYEMVRPWRAKQA